MTSANTIYYRIFHKGQEVGEHSQNRLCKSRAHLVQNKFFPPEDYEIQPYGLNEEEEEWEGEKINLRSWLIGEGLLPNSIAVAQVEPDWRLWPERFNQSVELAEKLVSIGAYDLSVFYDSSEDYMVVTFVLFGRHYWIRSYKFHRLRTGQYGEFTDFGRSFETPYQICTYLVNHERDY